MSIQQRILAILGGWMLLAAVIGWVVFDFLYVEHGTGILWLAGVGAGFVVGLAHSLVVLVRRRQSATNSARTDEKSTPAST